MCCIVKTKKKSRFSFPQKARHTAKTRYRLPNFKFNYYLRTHYKLCSHKRKYTKPSEIKVEKKNEAIEKGNVSRNISTKLWIAFTILNVRNKSQIDKNSPRSTQTLPCQRYKI